MTQSQDSKDTEEEFLMAKVLTGIANKVPAEAMEHAVNQLSPKQREAAERLLEHGKKLR